MRRLLDLLFPPRADELTTRDLTTDEFLTRLSPKVTDYTQPATVTLLPFHDEAVRATLHEAKYRGSAHAFALLAAALEAYLTDLDERVSREVALIPVPLGRGRRKERGYNQVEEVLRLFIKQNTNFVLKSELLTRIHETASQVSLPRQEREKNMRGAFSAAHPLDPTFTYIIVDDVITTGATLQAAIDALAKAGATDIIPLALAH